LAPQFSAHLAAQIATEGRIQAVQHWILEHQPLELTAKTLASWCRERFRG
jgi:hypothetical protein